MRYIVFYRSTVLLFLAFGSVAVVGSGATASQYIKPSRFQAGAAAPILGDRFLARSLMLLLGSLPVWKTSKHRSAVALPGPKCLSTMEQP